MILAPLIRQDVDEVLIVESSPSGIEQDRLSFNEASLPDSFQGDVGCASGSLVDSSRSEAISTTGKVQVRQLLGCSLVAKHMVDRDSRIASPLMIKCRA